MLKLKNKKILVLMAMVTLICAIIFLFIQINAGKFKIFGDQSYPDLYNYNIDIQSKSNLASRYDVETEFYQDNKLKAADLGNINSSTIGPFTASENIVMQSFPLTMYLKVDVHLSKKIALNAYNPNLDFGYTLAGDFIGDDIINSLDFSFLNLFYGKNVSGTVYDYYDLTGDSTINSLDFSILNSNWGKAGDELNDGFTRHSVTKPWYPDE